MSLLDRILHESSDADDFRNSVMRLAERESRALKSRLSKLALEAKQESLDALSRSFDTEAGLFGGRVTAVTTDPNPRNMGLVIHIRMKTPEAARQFADDYQEADARGKEVKVYENWPAELR